MLKSSPQIVQKNTKLTATLPPVVCLGIPRWEGSNYLSSTVQLMAELSRPLDGEKQRVLYVDYPYTYKDMWTARNKPESGVPLAELSGKAERLQLRQLPHGGEVQLLRLPPFIPANFITSPALYDQVLRWNARRAKTAIRTALAQLNWGKPIIINAFNPALGNMLAGQLDESLLVYYCYDEISAAPWMARHGARHEQAFLAQADLTIVSSQGLYGHKVKQAKQCALVKNGVDLSLFSTTGQRPSDLPAQAIIGYIGSVDDRLDYTLLKAISEAYPDQALVFLGRIVDEVVANELKKLPNVHLLGARPVEELGNYLAAFDLGLIPFVKNDLTAGIYPLKINEYLALGLPVISTNFADLSDFDQHTVIATDTNSFVRQLGQLLEKTSTPAEINNRKAFATQNSWTGRAEIIRNLLSLTLHGGSTTQGVSTP